MPFLPSLQELNELNRILLIVHELRDKNNECSIKSVIKYSSSITFGGRYFDHFQTLRLCTQSNFVSVSKNMIKLNELGFQFLKLNPDQFYEITTQQKDFVSKELIFNGLWMSKARDLFLSFNLNYILGTYDLSLFDDFLPKRLNPIINLLKQLNIIVIEDNKIIVVSKYVPYVNNLLSEKKSLSQDDLEKILQENRTIADLTENAVLEYERKRLLNLGKEKEAKLVRRISKLNSNAGYDIESFNGDKPLFDYDRLIEVKSYKGEKIRFFWSSNEKRVAEEKGNNYWIYLVCNFKKKRQIEPIMMQNPAKNLFKIKTLNISAASYLIEQEGDIPLIPIYEKNTKGYKLKI
jgi:hypothetical protein